VVEEGLRCLERGRIARAQTAVDLHDRVFGRLDLVSDQRIPEEGTDVQAVNEQDLELLDACLMQSVQDGLRDLFVALKQNLAGLLVDHVLSADLADQLSDLDRELIDFALAQALDS